MSKLAKLKDWLSADETARYLSSALGEAVSPADVLHLALSQGLKLSLLLPNHTPAKRIEQNIPTGKSGDYTILRGDDTDSDLLFANVEKKLRRLSGVYELSSFYATRLAIQHELLRTPVNSA